MTSPRIRVIIADDHSLMRLGIRSLVATERDIETVGEGEDGPEAIELTRRLHPNVVIMDLMMPGMSGAEATRIIHQEFPSVGILIFTSFADSADLIAAVRNGALGVLLKDASDELLIKAIRAVAAGQAFIPPEIGHLIAQDAVSEPLTQRQTDILASVTRGLTNRDIARQFDISEIGVKKHLQSIFQKLGVASRAEAAAIALRKHLLKA